MRLHKDAVRHTTYGAEKILRSGKTSIGVRTHSRYGTLPGSYYAVRQPQASAVHLMRYHAIKRSFAQFTRASQLGSVRYYPWKWTVPAIRGTTRSHIDVTLRKPNRRYAVKGFRTSYGRLTHAYVGNELPKYLRKYPTARNRRQLGVRARGMRFDNARVAYSGHRAYVRFPNSRRELGQTPERKAPWVPGETWITRYTFGKFQTKRV